MISLQDDPFGTPMSPDSLLAKRTGSKPSENGLSAYEVGSGAEDSSNYAEHVADMPVADVIKAMSWLRDHGRFLKPISTMSRTARAAVFSPIGDWERAAASFCGTP